MNHIRDAKKMVSDTPRTEREAFIPHDSKYRVCNADFARQLEHELNAANERVKRLEEAGDAMYHYCDAASRFGWKQAKETQP